MHLQCFQCFQCFQHFGNFLPHCMEAYYPAKWPGIMLESLQLCGYMLVEHAIPILMTKQLWEKYLEHNREHNCELGQSLQQLPNTDKSTTFALFTLQHYWSLCWEYCRYNSITKFESLLPGLRVCYTVWKSATFRGLQLPKNIYIAFQ